MPLTFQVATFIGFGSILARPKPVEDARIRQHIDSLARALRGKDVDALMRHYSPDIVTYDLMPLECRGASAYRKNFVAWFASVQGPIDYEMRELEIEASGDIAVCHHLAHVRSTRNSGEKNDYWVRVSAGLRRLDGRWLVVHEHVSLPFRNGQAMQAALARP